MNQKLIFFKQRIENKSQASTDRFKSFRGHVRGPGGRSSRLESTVQIAGLISTTPAANLPPVSWEQYQAAVRSLSVSFFIEKEPHSSQEWNERGKAKVGGRDTTNACELGHSCIAKATARHKARKERGLLSSQAAQAPPPLSIVNILWPKLGDFQGLRLKGRMASI